MNNRETRMGGIDTERGDKQREANGWDTKIETEKETETETKTETETETETGAITERTKGREAQTMWKGRIK